MENGPFEDVFPLEDGDIIFHCYVSLPNMFWFQRSFPPTCGEKSKGKTHHPQPVHSFGEMDHRDEEISAIRRFVTIAESADLRGEESADLRG